MNKEIESVIDERNLAIAETLDIFHYCLHNELNVHICLQTYAQSLAILSQLIPGIPWEEKRAI